MQRIDRPDFQAPRKLKETVWSGDRLRLPLIRQIKRVRWPWIVLIAVPLMAGSATYLWHNL